MADRSVNGTKRSCCARSSSNGWSSAPAAVTGTRRLRPRPRLAYAAEFTFVADGWQRSDGRMVRTTSAFLMRWTKRGLGLWSTAHGARYPAPVGSSLAALSVGAFPGAHALPFPVPYCTLFAATCAFSVARPSLRRPLPHAIRDRWWPIAFGTLSPPRTDCSETLK